MRFVEDLILSLARKSIEWWMKSRKRLEDYVNLPDELKEKKGVFVTIFNKETDELRGCIGYPYPVYPLGEAVIRAAREATEDPRFEKLKEDELEKIKIEVSILSMPRKVEIDDREKLPELLDKKKGYIIKYGFSSGLFLPQVWKEIEDPIDFLNHLCLKAGLDINCWKDDDVEMYEFDAKIIEE